ncbi:cytidylate kinase-like family protein [bacterium]|nr:MAG: cytidylate kinase-like family protein [bacterium]
MAIVTISRATGSGGEDIGRAVAEKLGYAYVGRQVILKEIEERGEQWLRWGKEMDEHAPSLWERFDQSFAGFVTLEENSIYQHAVKDNVVIMGRGGNWLLKDVPYALRVRITAPIEKRIDNICERESIDRESAQKMIEESDHERASYLKTVYHKDWTKPKYYDKVYDLGRMTFDEVVEDIIKTIPAQDSQGTEKAKEKLAQIALAAKVKSGIVTDLKTSIPTLEVIHDGKAIVLKGVVGDAKEHKRADDIANELAAPTKVKSKLRFRGG